MKPKVSIVVPIYNVESYIKRCFDSLVTQTLSNIEIIAINDGSTDQSLAIVQEFAAKDQRIKVIDKKNGGVSSARNEGVAIANGDYIGFVDPDDWIDKHMYQNMYEIAIEDKSDIVMCSYIREFGTHLKEKRFDLPNKITYKDEEVRKKIMRRLVGPIGKEVANPELLDAWGTVWSKLYRSEMLKENNLTFTDLSVIGTNEDSLFNIQAFYYTKIFSFINKPYYHYWRANTTSVTTSYKPELIDKWSTLYQIIEEFIKEKELEKDYYIALNNRISMNTLGLGLNEISKANRSSALNKIKKINEILNNNRIIRSTSDLQMKHFPFIWKVFYFFAKVRFALGFYGLLVSVELLRKMMR